MNEMRKSTRSHEGARRPKKLPKAVYIRRRIMVFMLLCMVIAMPLFFHVFLRQNEEKPSDIMSFESDVAFAAGMKTSDPSYHSASVAKDTPDVAQDKPEDNISIGPLSTQTPDTVQEATPAPDVTPTPNKTASPTPSPSPTPVAEEKIYDLPYYLYFEKGSFTLTIYEKDENGEYTKVYKTYRAAHGGNKTPAGKFELLSRERWHEFPDGGFVQYAVRYHARLYLHSPLYGAEDAKILWPMYYDGEHGIGKESTGGCIRMVTEAARFIYDNCPDGTILEIVNGSPKGTTSDPPPSRNGKRVDPTDVNVQ